MQEVVGAWSLPVIVLSYLVSVAGSFTAIYCALRIRTGRGTSWPWVGAAGTAMGGGGIWSMHFLGMLAYDMGMPVRYDLAITLGSLLVAILVTAVGLWVASTGPRNPARLVGGGVIMGLGVATMHYLGMAGMQMAAEVAYDQALVALSVLIAVVASIAALYLAFNFERASQISLSALVMGAAVCGMHYTGMAAATFTMMPGAHPSGGGVSDLWLGLSTFMVSIVLLLGLLYQALFTAAPTQTTA